MAIRPTTHHAVSNIIIHILNIFTGVIEDHCVGQLNTFFKVILGVVARLVLRRGLISDLLE